MANPKLSKAQVRVLEALTQEGAYIDRWLGTRDSFVDIRVGRENSDQRITHTTWLILYRAGYLDCTKETWRESNYVINDAGRAALQEVQDGRH